ncbi:helix-turn-helix protein [Cricetibacter osteomyelitidis]|uniref:Helix-turn-helix protein n=1 Tax=Cricetibacter osteomyelitidis TaxID=1521931 RepID=A0A4R2T7X0_9PAST|nr:helix-turn-helix protein [Cricetibacter osteomyelitidis]
MTKYTQTFKQQVIDFYIEHHHNQSLTRKHFQLKKTTLDRWIAQYRHLGNTGLASGSTRRVGGLSITTPSADIVNFLITGNQKSLNWGVFLVLGIFVGSYIAARGSREFRWRLPDIKTLYHSVIGGLMMGVGASLAGGCTIGNGLTATAVMSSKGWIALGFTIIGVWTAAHFIFVLPRQRAQAAAV